MKGQDTNQNLKVFFKYFIKYLFNPQSYYDKYDVSNSSPKQGINSNQKKVVQKMNNNIDYTNKFKISNNSYGNKFKEIVTEQDYKREYIEDNIKSYKEEDMEEDVEEDTGYNMRKNIESQLRELKRTEANFDSNKLDDQQILLDFNPQNIKMGFIYSEILGKPKCKRRGRG